MLSKEVLDDIMGNVYIASKEILGDKLEKVVLYGSVARGDNDESSDIDILILANIPAEKAWGERMKISKLTGWIDLEYDVILSLLVRDSATFNKYANDLPFYANILKEGVVVNA